MNENLRVVATAEDSAGVLRNGQAANNHNNVVVFGPHQADIDGRVPSFDALTEGPQSNRFVCATRHQESSIAREFHCEDAAGMTHTITSLKQLRLLFGFGGTVGSKWRNATAEWKLNRVTRNWFSPRSFSLLIRNADGFLLEGNIIINKFWQNINKREK